MTKKRFSLMMVLALLANMVLALPALAAPPQPEDPKPIYRGDTIDIGPVLRAKDLPIVGTPDISADDLAHSLEIMATQAYTTGDQLTFLALDDYNGYYFFTTYTVMTVTEHSEVWVQNDLNYYNTDGSLNTIHPDASDPLYVTEERMDYLANAFNTIAYPTDTGFFGMPDSHDGSNSLLVGWGYFPAGYYDGDGDKNVILVSNVRDTNFYDPVASGSYIAGFYSPTFEAYSDRNMVTIDSKQWHRRVGGGVDRPYLYDSVLAHEFQHLIHDDYSPNEDTWPNEAMSGFAEFLNGYWFTDELGDRTQWQTWPENSVVLWGDQNSDQGGFEILADYQLVNSFALYTTGRIGGVYTDTAKITQESEDGILGFNKWLSDTAATNPDAVGLTFEDLFEDFRADMLFGGDTDGAQPQANWNANFVSDYESPLEKSGGPATSKAYLGLLRDNLDREGYDTAGVPPFGTDFVEVCWSEVLSTTTYPVAFDGDEAPPKTAWSAVAATDIYTPSGTVAGDVLHSGHSDLTDNFLIFGPITPTTGDALTFDHYYNIEDEWDYGFVQVTTDTTGMTGWTSLDMTGMVTATDSHAHPVIVANVPGFSGFSSGWITATYDIGADYNGEGILLAFRYSTDWASDGSDAGWPSGWAIDNVAIGSTTLTTGDLGDARSIQEVRDASNRFAFEFLTWGDGDAITVTNVHTASLSAAMAGTLDLATAALSDTGFDEAGERGVFMVSLMMDVFDDLIAGGLVAEYGDYSLTGLPPSICTSDVDAYGDTHAGAGRVYAGQIVTAAVHADNLGSSPNITTTGPATFYIGMVIPDDTTYKWGSATGGAGYVANLSWVADSFPTQPGVYWTGSVARTKDFEAAFTTDSDLTNGETITVTVYFASDDTAAPTQAFTDIDSVEVVNAFGLSGLMADKDPVLPETNSQFTAKVLNLSHSSKPVRLVADHPADTTFVGVTGATVVATSATQVTVTQVITPYEISGAVDVTFQWLLGSSYDYGDVVTSTMVLADTTTDETFDLSATADVGAASKVYLPIVERDYSAP